MKLAEKEVKTAELFVRMVGYPFDVSLFATLISVPFGATFVIMSAIICFLANAPIHIMISVCSLVYLVVHSVSLFLVISKYEPPFLIRAILLQLVKKRVERGRRSEASRHLTGSELEVVEVREVEVSS